ncbi:SDR family oxidoreductase [Flavobacterium sp. D11R37]|uniref:SDR family oxidoreductase n=1 Tax=Flavobacterium coralii TaxID=2838017 RepID=UPI001CA61B7D|nr:SDR family oxidoreductase [Flavobacterium coralii]MBY8962060.1 SDR family oxidoreductase [Flavobacterium coralii]
MAKILVTGATGTIGKLVVKHLENLGADYLSGTRNPKGGKDVYFDYNDPSSFKNATEGVDTAFVLGPPLVLGLDAVLTPFLDFLKEKGILRVVYFSAYKGDKMQGLDFHPKLEQKLKDDGFDYTILRPTFFAQNFKNYEGDNITQRDIIFMPAGDGKASFIDADNIAEVAAIALTQPGHSGKVYELTGPESVSYHDVAKLLTEITGRTISYPNPSPEQFKSVLTESGAPEFIADYLISVYGTIAANNVDSITDDYKKITGKEPTPIKKVLEQDFAQ